MDLNTAWLSATELFFKNEKKNKDCFYGQLSTTFFFVYSVFNAKQV